MICPLTGQPHKLLWMRSAWWCQDCRQKLETCCEGDCPSVVEAELPPAASWVTSSTGSETGGPARTGAA
jgi:hypothetical protein